MKVFVIIAILTACMGISKCQSDVVIDPILNPVDEESTSTTTPETTLMCDVGFCKFNSVCSSRNRCNCTSEFYSGNDCGTPICPEGCSNRGTCTDAKKCTCDDPTEWKGHKCHIPICNPECVKDQGTCIAPNTCKCTNYGKNWLYWEGLACEIPVCHPRCSNGGTCSKEGYSDACYCPGQWSGSDCTILNTKMYTGNSAFTPDGTSKWTTSSLLKNFVPDPTSLPPSFSMQPSTAEHCCPCGTFVQDGNCYWTEKLPNTLPYLERTDEIINSVHACFAKGGTLATFERGNSMQKMANFFKWLATDANIQTGSIPIDFDPSTVVNWENFTVGIYRDYEDSQYYWETNPPTLVSSSLFLEGQPADDHNWACAVPHKMWPRLRSCDYKHWSPVICMIRNPCSQSPVCKPGKPGHPQATRMFDRCMTTGNNYEGQNPIWVDRMTAAQICTNQGGVLPAVRQQYEMKYWSFALYWPIDLWYPWIWNVWVGLNHFKSDYYWDSANKQLTAPLHIDWNYMTPSGAEPNQPIAGQCSIATANGWHDQTCTDIANFACEGSTVDSASLTTTTPVPTEPPSTSETTTTTSTTTSTTTTEAPPAHCQPKCPIKPDCPSGYFYSSCFDSCYKISTSRARYLPALRSCMADNAMFVSFNSKEEYNYIINSDSIRTTENYMIGLQDWVRRTNGDLKTIGISSTYNGDSDGIWSWMDGSGTLDSSTIPAGIWKTPVGTDYDFLIFGSKPVPASNKNDGPFTAFLGRQDQGPWWNRRWEWVLPMSASNNFNLVMRYICEYNFACTVCPLGWRKFNKKCYKTLDQPTWKTMAEAERDCNDESAIIMMPKDDAGVLFARMYTDFINAQSHWINMKKTDDGFQWGDGTVVTADDALDINVQRVFGLTAFKTTQTNSPESIGTVRDNFNSASGGWNGANPTLSEAATTCEMDGGYGNPPTTTTSSTTTATTMTTTPCATEGCCPCNWFRYRSLTTGEDLCFFIVYDAYTFDDAQQYCARLGSSSGFGAYLAITDVQQKIFFLTSHAKWRNDSYWVGLTKNSYGIMTWPNNYGAALSPQIIGNEAQATGSICAGSVLSKSTNLVRLVCSNTSSIVQMSGYNITKPVVNDRYPFICETAMALGFCPVCKPPLAGSGLKVMSTNSNRQKLGGSLTMPLRVSPDKCIWMFQQQGTKQQNNDKCKVAGMQPVALYQQYESNLVKTSLAYLGTSVWIDLVLRNKTDFTWEGETSSYNRWAVTSDNDWHKPCVSVTNYYQYIARNCEDKQMTACTVPSASSCADLCPFGYTAIGGSCFIADITIRYDNPTTARARCFSSHGTYNLASPSTDSVIAGLFSIINGLNVPQGTLFWAGLDDSFQPGHSAYGVWSNIVVSPDPDGIWQMDIGEKYPRSGFSPIWADATEPKIGNTWALFNYSRSGLTLITAKASDSFQGFIVCERPKPCYQCEKGWTFFNGHCYLKYNNPNSLGLRALRGYCDFQNSYVLSVGSAMEQMFAENYVGRDYIYHIGLLRLKSFGTPSNESWYEWDEGGRLTDTQFSWWRQGSPDFGGGSSALKEIAVMFDGSSSGKMWNDRDSHTPTPFIICEKDAFIPSIRCPSLVSSGSICGDNLVSPQFTNPSTGYTASSTYTIGSLSYSPNGILMSIPWSPNPDPLVDESPWINIYFGSTPVFVRAVATMGGQSVAGMVTAYSIQYLEYDNTSQLYTDLFVHKSTSPLTKNSPIVFAGNAVATSRNSQEICPRIKAYHVRLMPKSYYVHPYIRIEVKGCSSITKHVYAFCSCWVEIFDSMQSTANHNPYWWNKATADSMLGTTFSADSAAPQFLDTVYSSGTKPENLPNGWAPNTADDKNWWQVTFAVLKVITGLVMRGNPTRNEWIQSYYVQWSHTGYEYTFIYYMSLSGQPRLFVGPYDAQAVIQQTFCPPMKALVFRIIPDFYNGRPAMIVNIFGCMARGKRCFECCDEIGLCNCNCPVGWTGSSCATVSTDRNYHIDAQPPICETHELTQSLTATLSASSGTASLGYWKTPTSWSPSITDTRPYWQIDFNRVYSVSMISVAGGTTGWVSRYHLWFLVQSSNGNMYYPVLENQNNPQSGAKAIPGAREAIIENFIPYRLCPNIRSQALRFQPLVINGTTNMRFKIFGCPSHASCLTCCTYSEGCKCKCPVGFTNNLVSSPVSNPWDHCDQWNMMPIDCEDLALRQPNMPSGVYPIYPIGKESINVYCDMNTLGGGWTVIQNRMDSSQDFFKSWNEYKTGFGNLELNFWLGNDNIHALTSTVNSYNLLVKLTSNDNQLGLAYYQKFYLGSETDGYALNIQASGDSCEIIGDSLISHNGQRFYTRDNDTSPFKCSANSYGGWWYKSSGTSSLTCHDSNLNAPLMATNPGTAATWKTWRGQYEAMKTIRLMIRRTPLGNVLQPYQPTYPKPIDCQDILEQNPHAGSGVYDIYLVGKSTPVSVFCEMVALGGGWTVIQRHFDNAVNFNRNSSDYNTGFGSASGNYYLGNENIQLLTNWEVHNLPYQLAAVMEDSAGEKRTSLYQNWYLDESTYVLRCSGYNFLGDIEAGGDGFKFSTGRSFQTMDMPYGQTCPALRTTGWWWKAQSNSQCSESNLNGPIGVYSYEGGMFWAPWKGRYEALKTGTMMVKRLASKPIDCEDLYIPTSATYNKSGVFWIYPYGTQPLRVYCLFDSWSGWTNLTGWTVFQRRISDSVKFDKTWAEYKAGFQSSSFNANSNVWMGLENLYKMVSNGAFWLRVRIKILLKNGTVNERNRLYSDFRISNEEDGYRLFVKDAVLGSAGDSLAFHNMMPFSAKNEGPANACVEKYGRGGWWHNPADCDGFSSNLNGMFNVSGDQGMYWKAADNSDTHSIFYTEMSIRRKPAPRTINLPLTNSKRICGNLDVVEHQCQHSYQAVQGSTLRVSDPNTPGYYDGTDLICKPYPEPMDCSYYQRIGNSTEKFLSQAKSDLYTPATGTFTAYCDQETMGGGWTVVQRRVDSSTFLLELSSFDMNFGQPAGSYWVGHNAIRGLTTMAKYELLVELRTNLSYAFVLYDLFYTTSDVNMLHVENSYRNCSTAGDSLSVSEDKPFIYDTCGAGAWWFPQSFPCGSGSGNSTFKTSNLNAPWGNQDVASKGIYWWSFGDGFSPNLMAASMKIRRKGIARGRYIVANNFTCDRGSSQVVSLTPATAEKCQEACTNSTSFYCLIAVWNRDSKTCTLRNDTCQPPGQGSVTASEDTFFRVDECNHMSTNCGPAPHMAGTNQRIVAMPAQLSVNYTCRGGFINSLWAGDWTVLTCNPATKRWEGQFLDCKTLCGEFPDLSPANAMITPNVIIDGGTITVYYVCQPDYEWRYGDLTRVCEPPYSGWLGDPVFCNTTRCATPPTVAYSTNNFTIPTPAPLPTLTRRYTVWNYTCNLGYVFKHSLEKWNTIKCVETKFWSPLTPGECVPFRCENPPTFDYAIASPTFTNFTYFEYGAKVFYRCLFEMTLDPLNWDNNITIGCVGNQTWGVLNYAGQSQDWLPSRCICKN